MCGKRVALNLVSFCQKPVICDICISTGTIPRKACRWLMSIVLSAKRLPHYNSQQPQRISGVRPVLITNRILQVKKET